MLSELHSPQLTDVFLKVDRNSIEKGFLKARVPLLQIPTGQLYNNMHAFNSSLTSLQLSFLNKPAQKSIHIDVASFVHCPEKPLSTS